MTLARFPIFKKIISFLKRYLLVKVLLIVILFLLANQGVFHRLNQYLGLKDDNPLEEFAEAEINQFTKVKIDLTPLSGEEQTDTAYINQPVGFPILEKQGFSLQYDSRNKIPLWTWEVLEKNSLEKNVNREGMQFSADFELPLLHQSTTKDYRGSGFDRGHMVPAVDVSFSEKALKHSFLLTNVCPQNAKLNRGFWLRLERYIRDLIREENFQKVSVATGPLFLPQKDDNDGRRYVKYEVIGENNVAVPTHIFKLIHAEKPTETRTKAYIVPNVSVPRDSDFQTFEVSIEKLEKLSGLLFQTKQPD